MKRSLLFAVLIVGMLMPPAGYGADTWQDMNLSKGQRVFVPMAHNTVAVPGLNLTRYLWSAAIIRNVDFDSTITLTKIVAVAPDGKIEKFLLKKPMDLAPRASHFSAFNETGVELYDWVSGRPGFYVEWKAKDGLPVVAPMIGSGYISKEVHDPSGFGYALSTSESRVIAELQ